MQLHGIGPVRVRRSEEYSIVTCNMSSRGLEYTIIGLQLIIALRVADMIQAVFGIGF